MKTALLSTAAALLLTTLVSCGGSQQTQQTQAEPAPTAEAHSLELGNAIETRWLVAFLDEGTMLVALRPDQHEVDPHAEVPEDLGLAIADAAAIRHGTSFPAGLPDLDIDAGDPGEVIISGKLDSEAEAVAVIDAALSVQGVQRVRANLEWPGSRMELSQLHEQYR